MRLVARRCALRCPWCPPVAADGALVDQDCGQCGDRQQEVHRSNQLGSRRPRQDEGGDGRRNQQKGDPGDSPGHHPSAATSPTVPTGHSDSEGHGHDREQGGHWVASRAAGARSASGSPPEWQRRPPARGQVTHRARPPKGPEPPSSHERTEKARPKPGFSASRRRTCRAGTRPPGDDQRRPDVRSEVGPSSAQGAAPPGRGVAGWGGAWRGRGRAWRGRAGGGWGRGRAWRGRGRGRGGWGRGCPPTRTPPASSDRHGCRPPGPSHIRPPHSVLRGHTAARVPGPVRAR